MSIFREDFSPMLGKMGDGPAIPRADDGHPNADSKSARRSGERLHPFNRNPLSSPQCDEGKSLNVILPIEEYTDSTSGQRPFSGQEKDKRVAGSTILLVEDDRAVRRMVKKLLEMQGATVCEAISGKNALELWPALSDSITLVVSDIVMPDGVSGWDLAEGLSRENPGLPILLTSGYNEDPADHPFPAGAPIAFLQKPFEIEEFKDTLEKLLSGEAC